jgi:hypothetical protein
MTTCNGKRGSNERWLFEVIVECNYFSILFPQLTYFSATGRPGENVTTELTPWGKISVQKKGQFIDGGGII